jgi:acyl-CoA synthetase (AMP-forming)/AMP-acid ligase II
VIQVFLPSPRNSKEAHVSLFTKLECKKLIVTEPPMPCVPGIVNDLGVNKYTLPSLPDLLKAEDVKPYPYSDAEEARSNPIFVLHTSGSTGLPKPLTYTNDFISRLVTAAVLPAPEGHKAINEYFRTGKFFITLPPFHVSISNHLHFRSLLTRGSLLV